MLIQVNILLQTRTECGKRFSILRFKLIIDDICRIPLKNVENDFYARDTSKKIRAVMRAKGNSGEHLCTNPPYGYKKRPGGQETVDSGRGSRRSSQTDFRAVRGRERANADCKAADRRQGFDGESPLR